MARKAASDGGSDIHRVPVAVPEPPFSAEVVASYDAGVYPEAVSEHLQSHLRADPHSQYVLSALGRVRRDLAAIREPGAGPDLPEHVRLRVDSTLAGLAREVAPLRPHRARKRVAIPIAAGVAGVAVACAAVVAGMATLGGMEADSAHTRAQHSVAPLGDHNTDGPGGAGALAALSPRGDLLDGTTVSACLQEHGFGPDVRVIASRKAVVDGAAAVVFLLPDAGSDRLISLTVRPSCGPGDPAFVRRVVLD